MTRISSQAIFPRSSWSATIYRQSELKGICLILDHDLLRIDAEQAMTQALTAGIRFFQYRNKYASRKDIYETALRLSRTARQAGALFVVNDHTDIAVAVDADGVHLGQDDLPIECARKVLRAEKIIGISTHSIEQAQIAQAAGADYIGFGPIFPTATKDAGALQGIATLSAITKSVSLPVIAIGGINHTNIRDVLKTGAPGAAVISAILSTDDITSAAEAMLRIV
jgi:thiamine-phosphate pyrophosphorylase